MKIIIEISFEVPADAYARIEKAVSASMMQECDFQGCEAVVQRGDFTTIDVGSAHPQASRLHAFVCSLASSDECFQKDKEGYLLVPLSNGGFEKQIT